MSSRRLTAAQRRERDSLRWQKLAELVRRSQTYRGQTLIDSIDGGDHFIRFEALPDGRVAVEFQPSRRP